MQSGARVPAELVATVKGLSSKRRLLLRNLNGGFPKLGVPLLGSQYEELWYFGVYIGVPLLREITMLGYHGKDMQ